METKQPDGNETMSRRDFLKRAGAVAVDVGLGLYELDRRKKQWFTMNVIWS